MKQVEVVSEALHVKLRDKARARDLVDVAYRQVDSPLGKLLLAATEQGLVRVAFDSEGHDAVLGCLAESVSPRILADPLRLEPVARQLGEYFECRRQRFDVALDMQLSSGFRRDVVETLRRVDFGEVISYARLAEMSGRPKAVRAAGTACATNPLPVVVPCHRIVRSDGKIGNYLGGSDAKAYLIQMEKPNNG